MTQFNDKWVHFAIVAASWIVTWLFNAAVDALELEPGDGRWYRFFYRFMNAVSSNIKKAKGTNGNGNAAAATQGK